MNQKISLFLVLSLLACGGSQSVPSQVQTQDEPIVIEGGYKFDENDLFSFLLKVWYPGSSQSYFTWPNVKDSWTCDTGTMTSEGVLDIQDSGWNGEIVYTFNECMFEDSQINSGTFTIAFDGIKYLGEGTLKINGQTCSAKVSGDWEKDSWVFCSAFHIDANL